MFLDKWAAGASGRRATWQHQILEKRVGVVFVATMAVLSVAARADSTLDSYLPIIFAPVYVLLLFYRRLKRAASAYFIAATCTVFMAGLMLHDMSEAAESSHRNWPFAIILVDLLLVIRASSALTLGVVSTMCVYLMKETWRFGIFDLPILAPHEDRFCQGDCDKPPCSRTFQNSFSILVPDTDLFLLDFYFTRGFATQVLREKERLSYIDRDRTVFFCRRLPECSRHIQKSDTHTFVSHRV